MTDKKTIRTQMRAKVLAMSEMERSEASRRIFSQVASLAEYARAETVAAFVSLRDEPQTADFLTRVCSGKRLVLPRVEGETMTFRCCRPEELVSGAFGIMEPPPTAGLCDCKDIDLMIVPGTAFTPEGLRLGRGKGYYDRYMSLDGFRAFTVGVCFGCTLAETLPAEQHDRRVDMVISG